MTPDLLFKVLGDKWLRTVVTLLVLALLAHQASLLIWHLVPEQDLPAAAGLQQVRPSAETSIQNTDYQQQAAMIGRAFLFGRVEEARPVEVAVEQAPETQLNYKLRGIYYSPDDRLSSAIVEVKPNKSQSYRIDDELDDKITLAKIAQDHILINRYGKLERLNLQRREPPQGQTLRTSNASSASQTALLRSYKRRYTSNPMALATRFQAIPVQQDGKNIGFKLKALRGETLLNKLSFEPNDVFTAVNGVSLKNPFEALDALKSLTTANNVSVTFLRNGTEQTLDFRI